MDTKKKAKKMSLPGILLRVCIVGIVLYLLVQLVSSKVEISDRQQQLAALNTQLTAQETQNEELARVLESSDAEIVERVARDELGYAQPNERIFVDMSGK